MSLRLPPDQIAWLDQQAAAPGLTRAQAIRLCIWAAMNRGDDLPGAAVLGAANQRQRQPSRR